MAVASVVSWLAGDERSVERVHGLGRLLREEVFDGELREFARRRAGQDPAFAEYGRALAGHFWCDLLVEIAQVLDRGADLVGRVPGELADAVLDHEDAAGWGTVRRTLAREALVLLWKGLQTLLGADLGALVVQVRVLAVLICPDPGGHPRVARNCLRPMLGDTLRDHLTVDVHPEWLWGDRS